MERRRRWGALLALAFAAFLSAALAGGNACPSLSLSLAFICQYIYLIFSIILWWRGVEIEIHLCEETEISGRSRNFIPTPFPPAPSLSSFSWPPGIFLFLFYKYIIYNIVVAVRGTNEIDSVLRRGRASLPRPLVPFSIF